ncbi:MAG: DMT family transporter [Methyloligellaceae bacterium]
MSPALAYAMVFVGVIGHSTSEFFSVLSGVQGPEVSVWRYVIGAMGLLLVALARPATRDLWTPLKAEWRRLVPLSLLGISLAFLAFHWALDYATIVQVGTMVTTVPIFVGLANLFVNRMPVGGARILAGIAAFAGVQLLLTDGYLTQLAGDEGSLFGVLLALGCAALGSAYAVLVRPLINSYGALRITALGMSIGAAGLWIIVGVFWSVWVDPLTLFDKPPTAAWSLLVLGLWNTTITQVVWFGGLAAVPDITRGSYLFFLKPVITAALALAVLAQPITWVQVAAIIVICGSVLMEFAWPWVVSRRGRARP